MVFVRYRNGLLAASQQSRRNCNRGSAEVKRHNEIASLMGRLCDGENTGDVMGAAFLFLANVISRSCRDDDKEAFIDELTENLKLAVEDLDEGHGYKIEMGMQ